MRLGPVSGAEALMRLLKLTPRLLPALDLLLPLLSGPCFHPGTTADVALRGRIASPPGMRAQVCGWEGWGKKMIGKLGRGWLYNHLEDVMLSFGTNPWWGGREWRWAPFHPSQTGHGK